MEEMNAMSIPKEVCDHLEKFKEAAKKGAEASFNMGVELIYFHETKSFTELGYETIDDFVKKEFGLHRAQMYNLIKVVHTYGEKNDNGEYRIKNEYSKYTSTQLLAMIPLSETERRSIDPNISVSKIKQVVDEKRDGDSGVPAPLEEERAPKSKYTVRFDFEIDDRKNSCSKTEFNKKILEQLLANKEAFKPGGKYTLQIIARKK